MFVNVFIVFLCNQDDTDKWQKVCERQKLSRKRKRENKNEKKRKEKKRWRKRVIHVTNRITRYRKVEPFCRDIKLYVHFRYFIYLKFNVKLLLRMYTEPKREREKKKEKKTEESITVIMLLRFYSLGNVCVVLQKYLKCNVDWTKWKMSAMLSVVDLLCNFTAKLLSIVNMQMPWIFSFSHSPYWIGFSFLSFILSFCFHFFFPPIILHIMFFYSILTEAD